MSIKFRCALIVKPDLGLFAVQNTFLDKAESYGLPHAPGRLALQLLADVSTEQYLLDKQPFGFVRYVYSQVTSDFAPLEFDLARLSRRIAHNIAGKHHIQNTLDEMYKAFCYKQAAAQSDTEEQGQLAQVELPTAFAQPLSKQQLNALRARGSSVQLEELQRVFGLLDALAQQIHHHVSSASNAADVHDQQPQHLTPDASIKQSLTTLMGDHAAADQYDREELPFVQPSHVVHFFNEHGLQELQLQHLQPVLQFFTELYYQQEYQFANVSPLLKAPLSLDQADGLQLQLSEACLQMPSNAERLRELAASLRESELLIITDQASKGSTLHRVCVDCGFEPDEFPLTAIDVDLLCSQYVSIMKIVLQVRHAW